MELRRSSLMSVLTQGKSQERYDLNLTLLFGEFFDLDLIFQKG